MTGVPHVLSERFAYTVGNARISLVGGRYKLVEHKIRTLLVPFLPTTSSVAFCRNDPGSFTDG